MFTKSSFELKVGIFIFIGIVILSVIVFSIGNFYTLKRGYNVKILFSFANGLSKGAPVRYAGVEVGEVENINVYFDEKEDIPMVEISVWVSRNTWINEDAEATINTLGLLGEKYLEIAPGTKQARLLKNGETLRGQDPISTEEFTRDMKKTLIKVDEMISSLNDIVGDEEMKSSIKNAISNIEAFTADIKKHPWKILHKTKEKKSKEDK